jgi:hypothetical protein
MSHVCFMLIYMSHVCLMQCLILICGLDVACNASF